MKIELNKIYNENCIDTMKKIPDNFIDVIITSPPYDNLRTYDNIHLFNFDEFKIIAKEISRIIKNDGVIVWIVNDRNLNFSKSLTSFRQVLYFVDECKLKLLDTMINYKLVFLFRGISKVKLDKKYSNAFEYMFIFCKNKPKTFNPILKKTKNIKHNIMKCRIKNGEIEKRKCENKETVDISNVWIINNVYDNTLNAKEKNTHPAVFPKELVINHLKTWTNENDIVYDPFSGSGTTAKICKLMNRQFIGSEINKNYFDYSINRLKQIDLKEKGRNIYNGK